MNATVSILLIRNNKYVLQHRDNLEFIAYPNTYGVWGGSVETDDEISTLAALRELQEETGLIVTESDLISLGSEIREGESRDKKGVQIRFYYFVLHLEPSVSFKVHEGQGFIELPIPYIKNDKVKAVTESVITRYELYANKS